MRKYAILNNPINKIEKVMVYTFEEDEVYVFLYDTKIDNPSIADYLFEELDDADQFCINEYGISDGDWIYLEDPISGTQRDLIGNQK
ncbi:hypothetical protein ACFCYN_25130 [Gottfriedia sp. NPDC056225]|uniref:hypothetical protein n=1 Tax=Gottfriedia sp. NPDC056225 TaxID=3345751 RepID=UPI0035DA280F